MEQEGPGNDTRKENQREKLSARLAPGLYVTATPIGNAGDISLRALDVLARADLVLCEDTRVTAKLFAIHGIKVKTAPYHDHNAAEMRPRVLKRLEAGEAVALVSDAGTPLVSDPGLKLVQEAVAAGHNVTALPGASSVLAALTLAGLPTDRFFFAGFLSAKQEARRKELAELATIPSTLVFLESANRLAASLADMAATLGNREGAVARELTKKFEEVRRGPLAALAVHYEEAGAPKGEVVLVVGPPEKRAVLCAHEVDAMLENALARTSLKDAVAEVVAMTGLPRREIYARALELSGAK
ncbi:16S rRNA (cytidine(1402)-2'-O)-methyltransferase [Parvibaculum sp.]|uniref:16S rRNA (cytidine(1402)-2'-O)-methyltransferase n=1 Tax=Parvibaculum sp. TaxID=2024848 RepID=UPI00272F67A6|nr:16S rRNA (cytidine(1402)-2'-O)-methyltransferase [Parvibaculum sp.]MDP1626022.1 16S rRNA (cytidine(1402)-2'-O)-methyltransferase [Parvibaculum sp.]MDP2149727.1 16S rRNA (cytidine(1402)-2'-O)-methyltransferase [Parvibaculum sp.]MDP3328794.1 16S rRNA (cytidine(1402)-2'-O)-methyltransferase [Parvibaculum sp.]